MQTGERHTILRKLIASKRFDRQRDVLSAIRKKGLSITQATLSRDMRRIGVVKRDGCYYLGPVGYALDGFSKVEELKYVEPNIMVMKTTPGLAQAAAAMVDDSGLNGIAGTIAGDDTVLVIIDSPKLHATIQKNLLQLFSRTSLK